MRVAFLGLGIMGSRMAANLARAGHELAVWNRTAATARAWAAAHVGRIAASPADAARGAEVATTMVVDRPQVEAVLLGADGVVRVAAPGLLCVDMSTVGPAWATRIGARLADAGLRFVDAPVTGSSPKAEDGTLTIMAGGDGADVARARPLFEAMGETIVHVGPLGHGQATKLVNNAVAAANALVVAEALVAAHALGLDLDGVLAVLGAGAAASTMLALKAGPMRAHDYTARFKTEHMLKDVALCLEATREAGVPFEGAARVREALVAAVARGHGGDDFAALLEVVEAAAGRRLA
jgi:3-hydroxyisobutyrate dehydrogenase-like beta-hydroxyacid dehydrogenase